MLTTTEAPAQRAEATLNRYSTLPDEDRLPRFVYDLACYCAEKGVSLAQIVSTAEFRREHDYHF